MKFAPQILRNSMAYSSLFGFNIHIVRIRANRPKVRTATAKLFSPVTSSIARLSVSTAFLLYHDHVSVSVLDAGWWLATPASQRNRGHF